MVFFTTDRVSHGFYRLRAWKMIKVIGIDPGLAATGFGSIQGQGSKIARYAYGCINSSPKHPLVHRLEQIYLKIQCYLQQEKPDLVVIEDIFSSPLHPKSGISLGKVAGVILLAGAGSGIPVVEVAVREAKQVLTGNGNATKKQLEKAVRHLLGIDKPIRPDHASDAVALAVIGLYRYKHLRTKADLSRK